jgi:hypothetical protein
MFLLPQWLQACMKLDLSNPQHSTAAQAALQSMLDNISTAAATPAAAAATAVSTAEPADKAAAAAAAAATAAAQTQAELIAAECRIRSSAHVLGLSFEQQLQLRELVQQLLRLEASNLRVQLFLAEYEVSPSVAVH